MKYTMQDSRAFTDFRPNCEINQQLQQQYGKTDLHAYRYFLQQNAEKIMADTKIENGECKNCPVCKSAIAYKPLGNE